MPVFSLLRPPLSVVATVVSLPTPIPPLPIMPPLPVPAVCPVVASFSPTPPLPFCLDCLLCSGPALSPLLLFPL